MGGWQGAVWGAVWLAGCLRSPGAVSSAEPAAHALEVAPAPAGLPDRLASPGIPPPGGIDGAGLAALLANPTDRPLVLSFWATWCGPCAAELPVAQRVAARHPGVAWRLVNVEGAAAASSAARTLLRWGVGLPGYVLDAPERLSAVPGWPGGIPYTLVLLPGGRVHASVAGAVSEARLEGALPE